MKPSEPLLTPEEGDPGPGYRLAVGIDWRPRQQAYEAKRHNHKALYPNREIADFAPEEPEIPPPPAEPEVCPRCLGSKKVEMRATDAIFHVTCPLCASNFSKERPA